MYPILAQEGAINGAVDVNQSYRWSSEDFTPQAGSARMSPIHPSIYAANPSGRGDDLHKPRGFTER